MRRSPIFFAHSRRVLRYLFDKCSVLRCCIIIKKSEEAISDLYEKGLILSNLKADLHTVVGGIVEHIRRKRFSGNPIIDKELKSMELKLTQNQFAAYLVAEGEAKGKAEGKAEGEAKAKAEITQIIKLFLQGIAPKEVSAELGIPLKEVKGILVETGLLKKPQ